MPLAAIFVPQKFKFDYPKAYLNLQKNINRLTSTFDVHEMIMDIVDNKFRDSENELEFQQRRIGTSLFEGIPVNRTCKDAKIPDNFCVCQEQIRNIDVDWNATTVRVQEAFYIFYCSISGKS